MIKIWAEPKPHEFFLGEYYPLKKHEIWWWIRSYNKDIQCWIDEYISYKGTIVNTIYTIFLQHPDLILKGDVWLDIMAQDKSIC